MARLYIAFGLLCMVYLAYASKPIFDPHKCPNGCQSDDQCPQNAHCSLLNAGGTCGFCICNDGFKGVANKCNPEKEETTPKAGKGGKTSKPGKTTSGPAETTTLSTTESSTTSTSSTSTTSTSTTTTTTIPTTTGTTTQGPPPAPLPLNCADYDCTVAPPGGSNGGNPLEVQSSLVTSNPNPNCKKELVIPPRKCQMQGGGSCFGMYCLTVSPGNDYCICPFYKVDRQCAVDKPGQCSQATGQVPSGNTQLQGRRFRNPNNKDNGAVYGRHFAASMSDCIKLCQWAKDACRAVNFGQISGTNVCELLSSAATEKNLLSAWLEKADGWQYAQVGSAI